jgi:hypothetical protein
MVFDAGNIKSLFYDLPETDRYTRFFRHIKSLSAADVETLCNVDYRTAVAFVAVHGSRESNHVVGHACYFVDPSTNMAETVFMIAPGWQGQAWEVSCRNASLNTQRSAAFGDFR